MRNSAESSAARLAARIGGGMRPSGPRPIAPPYARAPIAASPRVAALRAIARLGRAPIRPVGPVMRSPLGPPTTPVGRGLAMGAPMGMAPVMRPVMAGGQVPNMMQPPRIADDSGYGGY